MELNAGILLMKEERCRSFPSICLNFDDRTILMPLEADTLDAASFEDERTSCG